MKRWIILAIVLAVVLLLAWLAHAALGVAVTFVYVGVGGVLVGWVVLPQPAVVTRAWAFLGLVDRVP